MNVRMLLWYFLFSINMVESNLTSETPLSLSLSLSLSLRNVLVVCYMHAFIDAKTHKILVCVCLCIFSLVSYMELAQNRGTVVCYSIHRKVKVLFVYLKKPQTMNGGTYQF